MPTFPTVQDYNSRFLSTVPDKGLSGSPGLTNAEIFGVKSAGSGASKSPVASSQPAPASGKTAPAGASATPAPVPSTYFPRTTSTDPTLNLARDLTAPTKPRTAQEIYSSEIGMLQPQIDAINSKFDAASTAAGPEVESIKGSARSIAAASGLQNSPEGGNMEVKANALGADILNKINSERNAEIQTILGNLSGSAIQQAKDETSIARTQAKDYIDQRSTEAQNAIKSMAASGYDLNTIKEKYPADFQYIVDGFNGDENAMRAYYIQNKPQGSLVNGDKPVISADGMSATFFEQVLGADGKVTVQAIPIHSDVDLRTKPNIIKDASGIYSWGTDANGTPVISRLGGNVQQPRTTQTPDQKAADLAKAQADVKEAKTARDAGADPDKVRQRFLDTHPGQETLYDSYFKPAI